MYIYLLQSINHSPPKSYIGITSNPKKRLKEHNNGKCKFTSEHKPWKFRTIIWLNNKEKAHKLERHLKSGSGRAFINRHF